MYNNADITLYSCSKDGKFTRKVIKKVFWEEVKQSLIEKTGMTNSDSVKIFIPKASVPDGLDLRTGHDIVVKDEVAFEFDNTSSQTISASLATLKTSHSVYTVTVADGKLYGSSVMQHYQLSCK